MVYIMVNKEVILNEMLGVFKIFGIWLGIFVIMICGFDEVDVIKVVELIL